MKARRYQLLSESRATRCKELLEEGLRDWVLEWLPEKAQLDVRCATADNGSEDWNTDMESVRHRSERQGSGWIAVKVGSGVKDVIARLLGQLGDVTVLSDGRANVIEAKVVDEALDDLISKVAERCGTTELLPGPGIGIPDAEVFVAGGGNVLATVEIETAKLMIVLSAAVVLRIAPLMTKSRHSIGAPVPCLTAIRPRQIELMVNAGRSRISIGELQALRPGDVIALDRSIHAPLEIRTSGREGLGAAFLGTRDGKRSIQIVGPARP